MPSPDRVTRTVQAGFDHGDPHRPVMPPVVLSSNFRFGAPGDAGLYDYTRSGNPTRDLLGDALADLEGGAVGLVTATGMAAVTTVLQLVPPGGRVVAPSDCYGGTHRLLTALERRNRITVDWVDLSQRAACARALASPAELVWIETPSNPLLRITDVAEVSRLAKTCGALVVADNTFLSPVLQRPLELGADVVVHSTTKYINGHSDVVGGGIVAADPGLGDELAWWANCLGVTGSPFDSFLTLRGMRTLYARMQAHLANAADVVDGLQECDAVRQVFYPGLATHPGHDVATRQQSGYGAIVSFELREPELVTPFVDALDVFVLAESLGGVESLVCHPATMTHASMDADARATAGISDCLLRLSVGIESGRDLVADLVSADRAVSAGLAASC